MIIVSLLESDPGRLREEILSAPQKADALEIRLDALRRVDRATLAMLFEDAPRPLVATCRRVRDGGFFAGSESRRREILWTAVTSGASYVDVEAGSGAESLVAALAGRPGIGVILSHHDARRMPPDIDKLYRRMAGAAGVKAVKIVGTARKATDVLAARDFLARVGRAEPRAAAFCMGAPGVVSRVRALDWGSWAIYVSPGAGRETAPGQVSLADLVGVYRVQDIDDETRFTAIIGTPLGHSLSPVMHNAAFSDQALNYRYVPLEIPHASGLKDLRLLARELRIRGISVTAPYKTRVMKYMDLIEPLARRVGAVNTILFDGKRMVGFNTDATGGLAALEDRLASMGLAVGDLSVAVIGSGGAARALAHAVAGAGAHLVVSSRSERPGRALARAIRGRYVAPAALSRERYDVLINCTPVGMKGTHRGRNGGLPVPRGAIKGRLVYDVIYTPESTRLLEEARDRGIATLGGLDMLVRQAAEQYALFSGRDAPVAIMRAAALQALRFPGETG